MPITFPKQYMTIKQLVDIGFASRQTLQKWVHIRGFPAVRSGTGKTANWIIDTSQIQNWQKEKGLLQ